MVRGAFRSQNTCCLLRSSEIIQGQGHSCLMPDLERESLLYKAGFARAGLGKSPGGRGGLRAGVVVVTELSRGSRKPWYGFCKKAVGISGFIVTESPYIVI